MSGAKEALTHHDWCYCYAALIRRNFAGITHLNTSTKSNAGTILSSNMQVQYILALPLLGTLFDPCRLAYLAYTSND